MLTVHVIQIVIQNLQHQLRVTSATARFHSDGASFSPFEGLCILTELVFLGKPTASQIIRYFLRTVCLSCLNVDLRVVVPRTLVGGCQTFRAAQDRRTVFLLDAGNYL